MLQIAQGIIERGLIFGIIVAAVYLSSRLIKFDNLAVEGAFGLGGALTALLISWNINAWFALASAALIGGVSGIATGLLNTKLKLNNLMSGIVVTTGLFSITLKIAGSNMALGGKPTIFTVLPSILAPYQPLLLLTVLCGTLFACINWFLKTEVGFLLRAVGDTPQMLTNVGKSTDAYIILGLTISNALAAGSGALFVQYVGYFSIWASVGVLIIGLAGMILAQALSTQFGVALLLGSIAYQAIIALTFELQLDQEWNKLITALLIVLLIVSSNGQIKNKELIMLQLKDIDVWFGQNHILRAISCTVQQGDFIVIVGANGAGKSTFFDTIAGKIKPKNGTLVLDGTDITQLNELQRAGMVTRIFQNTRLNSVGSMTVAQNLAIAHYSRRHARLVDGMRDMPLKKAEELVCALGMDASILDKQMNSLSGGQRQLIAFVMATQLTPKILLLDEATAALDPHAATKLLKHAAQFIKQHNITTLLITHDPHIALSMGNKVWVLKDGHIYKQFGPEEKKQLNPDQLIGQIDYEQIGA